MNTFFERDITKMEAVDSFCFQNCLRVLMEIQGIEHPVLYLNAALSLKYNKQTKKIKTSFFSLMPSVESCVVQVTYPEDQDPREVLKNNMEYVKNNCTPVAVSTDTYYLPYASNYKKNHARHIVLLCGLDEEDQSVEIIDWYPDWFFKGKVSVGDYLLSRTSENEYDGTIYSGEKVENAWFKIVGMHESSETELLKELFQVMRQEYFRESDDTWLYGLQAMEAMKDVIDGCMDKEAFVQLHKRFWFIEKRYSFLSSYLSYVKESAIKNSLERMRACLEAEAAEWRRMQLLSIKGSVMPSEKSRQKLKNGIDIAMEKDKDLIIAFTTLDAEISNL